MEESQVLTDIINCFTSIDQLLAFAHTYGLEDDPTVQLRFAHLRRQTSPLHIKCPTCGEFFRDQQKHDLHVVYHETIRDFDLNVFDEPHSVSNHAQTINPRKRKTSSLVSSTDTTQGPPPTKKKSSVSQNQYDAGVDTPSTHKISKKRERTYTKNGALDTTYDVKFSDKLQNKKLMDIVDDLHNIFDDVLGQVREGSQDNSLSRLIIEHNGLTDPIVVPLQELNKMDASTVMDEIGKVLQSNEELPVDDSFSVKVGRIDIPSGGGRVGITKLMGENNSIERKRSIISRSSETMCMPMAISICFLKTCRTASPGEWKTLTSEDKGCMADKVLKYRSIPMWFYRHVTDKGRKTCINFAKRLCELADVSTDKPCNIKEIERFEKVVDLHILVISAKLETNSFALERMKQTEKKSFFT
ncbi:unnamed protein product [Mytilus coruscus]|uniref:C2H2-type domain-containing protein n=1 Tax=Mytilus coruscus TaxID=42192 RepID=A0A6J8D621_MYTCO|nr:unnamed protein product [Mytilus coruscus]